jgi:hypothetical protein
VGEFAMTRRRHVLALLKRERFLARRLAEARRAGVTVNFLAAECSSLAWAVGEIGRLHPADVANARRDLERLDVPRPPGRRRMTRAPGVRPEA